MIGCRRCVSCPPVCQVSGHYDVQLLHNAHDCDATAHRFLMKQLGCQLTPNSAMRHARVRIEDPAKFRALRVSGWQATASDVYTRNNLV